MAPHSEQQVLAAAGGRAVGGPSRPTRSSARSAHAAAARVAAFPPTPGHPQARPASVGPQELLSEGPPSPRGWACPGGSPLSAHSCLQGQDVFVVGPEHCVLRPRRRVRPASAPPLQVGLAHPPPGHHGRLWTPLPLGKGCGQPGPSCAVKGPAELVPVLKPAARSQLPGPRGKSSF